VRMGLLLKLEDGLLKAERVLHTDHMEIGDRQSVILVKFVYGVRFVYTFSFILDADCAVTVANMACERIYMLKLQSRGLGLCKLEHSLLHINWTVHMLHSDLVLDRCTVLTELIFSSGGYDT
ncbi:hypothetical protein M8C21_003210, partial [Ambrosia artemisiifolia]